MKIQISKFSEGKHSFDFKMNAGEIGLDEPFFGIIVSLVDLEKFSERTILKFTTSCKGNFFCDRCLLEFEKIIEAKFQLEVSISDDEYVNKENFNLYRINHWSEVIDLTNDIKEYLELSIPSKILCQENCFGFCYQCGANLNNALGNKCNCKESEVSSSLSELKKVL